MVNYNILFIILSSKQDIISEVHFDRSGFGSRARTLQEAKRKDKSITAYDVNEFFRKNVEQKRGPTGRNSFAAPHSAHEYQIDLFFINDMKKQKNNVGMLTIDVFDTFTYVVPIKGKKEEDLASGILESLNKMGKKPKIIYTDDEGALSKESVQAYLKEQDIQHHITRAHPNFSERAVRTFKDFLYRRVEADEKRERMRKRERKHPVARLYI